MIVSKIIQIRGDIGATVVPVTTAHPPGCRGVGDFPESVADFIVGCVVAHCSRKKSCSLRSWRRSRRGAVPTTKLWKGCELKEPRETHSLPWR
jgi:hypothetical protein